MDWTRAFLGSRRFERLVRRTGVRPHEAEDVAQEARLRIWERRGELDPSRNVNGWADQVAVNQARMHLRGARTHGRVITPLDGDVRDDRPDPEAQALMGSRIGVLLQLIREIEPSRREVFVEHVLLEKSTSDIAQAAGLPLKTIEKRLRLARQDLERAAAKWQAQQRRRGWDTVPALIPFISVDVRSWMRRAAKAGRGWRGYALVVGATVIGASAPVAIINCRASASTPPPLARTMLHPSPQKGATAVGPLPTDAGAHPPGDASSDPATDADPKRRDPPPSGTSRAARLSKGSTDYHPREDYYINQAKAYLSVSDFAPARMLLEQHAREFYNGRLAPEREALLTKYWGAGPDRDRE